MWLFYCAIWLRTSSGGCFSEVSPPAIPEKIMWNEDNHSYHYVLLSKNISN